MTSQAQFDREAAIPVVAIMVIISVAVGLGFDRSILAGEPSESGLIQRHIQALSADDYVVRERAEVALIDAGAAAIAPLQQSAEIADLETQLRAKRILAIVLEADLDKRIAAFENDVDGNAGLTLPGWTRTVKRLGNDADIRQLFGEMYRSESAILSEYEKSLEAGAKAFALRVREIRESIAPRNSTQRLSRGRNRRAPLRNSVRTLLLIGSDPDITLPDNTVSEFDQLLQQAWPARSSQALSSVAPIKAWLGSWFEHRSTNPSLELQHLHLGMAYGVQSTLQLAQRVLKDEKSDVNRKKFAILCVAKFGNETHVPMLLPLLKNKTQIALNQRRVNKKNVQKLESQMRDVVLATLVHITHQDPEEYGILRQSHVEPYVFQTNAIFFPDDSTRMKALKKWDVWHSSHLTPPVIDATEPPSRQ